MYIFPRFIRKLPFKSCSIHLAKLPLLCRYVQCVYHEQCKHDERWLVCHPHRRRPLLFVFFLALSANKIRMLRKASSQYLPIWWNIYARVRTRSIIHRRYHHRYHSFHNLSIFYFHMISMSFCLAFLMFFFLCLSIFKRCELTCLKFLKFLHVVFTLLTFIFSQFQFVEIKSTFGVLFR